jgi:hypothetical protein
MIARNNLVSINEDINERTDSVAFADTRRLGGGELKGLTKHIPNHQNPVHKAGRQIRSTQSPKNWITNDQQT